MYYIYDGLRLPRQKFVNRRVRKVCAVFLPALIHDDSRATAIWISASRGRRQRESSVSRGGLRAV